MSRVLIVGAGAGGAAVARELAGRHTVTILETGGPFRPFGWNLDRLARARASGIFFDERVVRFLFPSMRVRKTRGTDAAGGMILVNGVGLGGTTTLSAGNALRCDEGIRQLGIDLDAEFDELGREIPITREHRDRWTGTTKRLAAASERLGLEPKPVPKLGDLSRCRRCGRCILGCPSGAKWDARRFLDDATRRGATIETNWHVESLQLGENGAVGVQGRRGMHRASHAADIIVLAAGGAGTPPILERSGIRSDARLFVDPVLCVAAPMPGAGLDHEISMPFVIERDRYIVSPYMDWLSFFFNRRWRLPARDIVPLMIKLADDDCGRVGARRIEKSLTDDDRARLADGIVLCHEILERVGAPRTTHFMGTVNAGHPGGALPVRAGPRPFHDDRLPDNVWVADASLIPLALGRPPILTILALAKRVARVIGDQIG